MSKREAAEKTWGFRTERGNWPQWGHAEDVLSWLSVELCMTETFCMTRILIRQKSDERQTVALQFVGGARTAAT